MKVLKVTSSGKQVRKKAEHLKDVPTFSVGTDLDLVANRLFLYLRRAMKNYLRVVGAKSGWFQGQ